MTTQFVTLTPPAMPPAAHKASRRAEPGRVQARYDAVQSTDENRNHWRNADGLSARIANSPEVRRVLRNRSRFEVCENNSYASGIVDTLCDDIIGTGPKLQINIPGYPAAGKLIEKRWREWDIAAGLPSKLWTFTHSKFTDGEGFLVKFNNPALPTAVKLDLREVEADQVTTLSTFIDPNQIDGIDLDQHGNPWTYHVLKYHPGDSQVDWQTIDYPAAAVLHWFKKTRPNQYRGIPELAPALELFAQLRRYSRATLAAAETAANISGVLRSQAAPHGADTADTWNPVELERNSFLTLPGGWDLTQLKAEQPVTTYDLFVNAKLREIARCLKMPFILVAGDASGANYSSARFDNKGYAKSVRIWRSQVERIALHSVLSDWIDEAIESGDVLDGLPPVETWGINWYWDGDEHVDPMKEAQAAIALIGSNLSTYADWYASQGQSWEEQFEQRAKENAAAERLKLTTAGQAPAAPVANLSPPAPADNADTAEQTEEDTADAAT